MLRPAVETQTARRCIWVNLILTLLVSTWATTLIPLYGQHPVAWFAGLSLVTYAFVHFGLAFRTKITQDEESKYTLKIPDHYSNSDRRIPLEYITHVEICEYQLFARDSYYPPDVNHDYYYRKTMLGYQGSGLIVCYQLPKSMTGDTIVRGIKFPAPRAEEFASFMRMTR